MPKVKAAFEDKFQSTLPRRERRSSCDSVIHRTPRFNPRSRVGSDILLITSYFFSQNSIKSAITYFFPVSIFNYQRSLIKTDLKSAYYQRREDPWVFMIP